MNGRRHISTVLVAFGLLVSCCANGAAQAQSGLERITVSGEHPRLEWQFLPIVMATAHGLWAQNGLDPEFPAAASELTAEALKGLVASGIKIGMCNTAEIPLARSRGVPIKVVAGYFGDTIAKLYTSTGSQLKSLSDLDGKKIGILTPVHTSFRTVAYMNAKLGIKAEAVPLGSLEKRLAALKEGKIDAFYSSEGAALPYVGAGDVKILAYFKDVYPQPYTAAAVWASDDLIKEKPDTVRKVVKTILESVKLIKENPRQAVDLYIERTKSARDVAGMVVAELTKFLEPSGKGSGAKDLLAAVAGNWEFTTKSGAVTGLDKFDIAQAVDTQFVAK